MPHKWEPDGERCEKCGAKDWMNITHCIDDEPAESDMIKQADNELQKISNEEGTQ